MTATAIKTESGWRPAIRVSGGYTVTAKIDFVHCNDAISFAEREIKTAKSSGFIGW